MAETQTNRRELVDWLQERVRRIETARQPAAGMISSGSAALDRLLPEGGFRPGTLVEWLSDEGCGATTLALLAARQACRDGRALVVIDPARRFYPPAAARLGVDLQNLLVVCPSNRRDQNWALNQVLQSSAVGALLCWLEQLDERGFRRLQLAAETGGVLGLLMRPANLIGRPSWAEVQLHVESLPGQGLSGQSLLKKGDWLGASRENREKSPDCDVPVPFFQQAAGNQSRRRLKVELLRCREGKVGHWAELEIDDETHALPLATPMAVAAAPRRAARA